MALLPALGWSQGVCAKPPEGISAWFTFDESQFQVARPGAPRVIPGRVGKALRFNGKDQFYEVPAGTKGVDVGAANFSIEMWIRTSDWRSLRNIIDKRSRTPFGYALFAYHGRPGVQIANGDHRNLVANKNIADDQWHHLVAVAQRLPPDQVRLYVDGVEGAVSPFRTPLNDLDVPEPLWLGRHHPNNRMADSSFYEGDIDELTFYKRALTAQEVKSIYLAGAKGKCKPPSR